MNLPASDPRAADVSAAIVKGDVARLRQLLERHPGLAAARIVDAEGTSRTLLHLAADWPGHFPNGAETVALLTAEGAAVNEVAIHTDPRRPRETALHWAASSDDLAVLDALLDCGADIEAPGAVFTGGAPMSDAVVFAQWHAARRLLERGARTTIWQAAALGLLDRVKACCQDQPPPSEQITNAFWHACRGGQQQTAEYLLSLGANPNWIGYDKRTPLQAAKDSGASPFVNWLRSIGAKLAEDLTPPR
ncbi:MAG: ankyrin repeat domain-containing protein [Bryobacterales bacterium]|nr:ankyrin repeat domain-containing protein [Bryobacterales bacterium]